MRRRREFYILNYSNTVLAAIVLYSLLIDAKDPQSTQASEMFANTTEPLITGMNAIQPNDNLETMVDGVAKLSTATHNPTLLSALQTASALIATQQQNQLLVPTIASDRQQITEQNDDSLTSSIVPSLSLTLDNVASTYSTATKMNSSINVTSSYNYNNNNISKNSTSSTSFNSIRFTTMRPFIVPTLPDFSRHRIGHNKQYQSKYHHDRHFGPFFEDPNAENSSGTMQMGFHQGTEAVLNCRVGMLKDKTVMWVRRTTDKVSLLTVGNVTYSGDPRIKVMFIYPNNWKLTINPIATDDAGLYMCQVSTHPPRVFATNLTVLAPAIRLVDEMGHEVSDRYYKLGSSVDITCQVALSFLNTLPPATSLTDKSAATIQPAFTTTTSTTVFPFIDTNLIHKTFPEQIPYNGKHKIKWKKDGKDLPKDIKINLSTSYTWRNSRISIIHAEKSHSGTYQCSVQNSSSFSSVNIQILMGETPAAVQHNHCSRVKILSVKMFIFNMGVLLILHQTLYISGAS